MAKTPLKLAPVLDETEEAEVPKYDFSIIEGDELPAEPSSSRLHPWATNFDRMDPDKRHSFFIATSYWYTERGLKKENAENSTYLRTKIRDVFNSWVAKDKDKRAALGISMFPRKKGDVVNGKPVPEDGMQIWLIRKK